MLAAASAPCLPLAAAYAPAVTGVVRSLPLPAVLRFNTDRRLRLALQQQVSSLERGGGAVVAVPYTSGLFRRQQVVQQSGVDIESDVILAAWGVALTAQYALS